MPVYEVPRTYVQVKRCEIADSVYIEADSPEEAEEAVANGDMDDIADSGEETGHFHEYGEIVSPIEAGSAELTDINPTDQ